MGVAAAMKALRTLASELAESPEAAQAKALIEPLHALDSLDVGAVDGSRVLTGCLHSV